MSTLINEANKNYQNKERHLYLFDLTGKLINEANKNYQNKERHLYLFDLTGKKGTETSYVQVYATCKRHAIDKAIKLHNFDFIGHASILGQAKKDLEDKYFQIYGTKIEELYGVK